MGKPTGSALKHYVLDANAVIRLLEKGRDWERVKALFEKAARGEARLLISAVNWGEVLYSLAKKAGLGQAKADLKGLSMFMETVPADETEAEAAATMKSHYRLGYGDCYAAALAIRVSGTVVTDDPDFARLGRRLKVLNLAPHKG